MTCDVYHGSNHALFADSLCRLKSDLGQIERVGDECGSTGGSTYVKKGT